MSSAACLVRAVVVGLAVVAMVACASRAPGPAEPGAPGLGGASVEIADLLGVQEQALARFDEAHAGPDRCVHLCEHLDAICVIGDRVCALAERHPAPPHAAACERATARCAATADRLPPECPCASPPADPEPAAPGGGPA